MDQSSPKHIILSEVKWLLNFLKDVFLEVLRLIFKLSTFDGGDRPSGK